MNLICKEKASQSIPFTQGAHWYVQSADQVDAHIHKQEEASEEYDFRLESFETMVVGPSGLHEAALVEI